MSEETSKISEAGEAEASSSPVESAEAAKEVSVESPGEESGVALQAEQDVEPESGPPKRPYRLPKWVDEHDLDQESLDEYEHMFQMYDETMKDIVEGEIVSGHVIAVENGEVIIDVGFKSEGAIPLEEFADTDAPCCEKRPPFVRR